MENEEEILKKVSEISNDFISKLNTVSTRNKLKQEIDSFLASVEPNQTFHNFNSSVSTAWKKMTQFEKIKWFIVNKMFPPVGKRFRNEIDNENLKRLNEAREKWGDDYPDYKKIKRPYWLEPIPKTLIIYDFEFKPIIPMT